MGGIQRSQLSEDVDSAHFKVFILERGMPEEPQHEIESLLAGCDLDAVGVVGVEEFEEDDACDEEGPRDVGWGVGDEVVGCGGAGDGVDVCHGAGEGFGEAVFAGVGGGFLEEVVGAKFD